MDRRKSIKSMLAGGITGSLVLSGCQPGAKETEQAEPPKLGSYGRTEEEKTRDLRLESEVFFSDQESETIATLCDLILPASETAGSATEAGVPEFIEFIVKDIRKHQIPIRGGLMWLDNRTNRLFNKKFISCSKTEQKRILDEIAYPEEADKAHTQGVRFFNLIRFLVVTGYYTSKMGLDDLGYQGNRPNIWDGVPENVLQKHGMSYDPEWLDKCIDQEKREVIASWDEEGNLIS